MKKKLYIRERRNQLGLSLRALAEHSSVDFAAIDKIERDERDPRLSTLVLLAEALGVDVPDLFFPPLKKKRGNRK